MNETVLLFFGLTIGAFGVVLYDVYDKLRDAEATLAELKASVADGKLLMSVYEQRERIVVGDKDNIEPSKLSFTVETSYSAESERLLTTVVAPYVQKRLTTPEAKKTAKNKKKHGNKKRGKRGRK